MPQRTRDGARSLLVQSKSQAQPKHAWGCRGLFCVIALCLLSMAGHWTWLSEWYHLQTGGQIHHPVEVPIAFDFITYPSVVGLPVPLSFGVEGMVEECKYAIFVHILQEGESELVYSRDVEPVLGKRILSFSFTPPPPKTPHKFSIKLWVYDNRRHPDDEDALLAYALKVVEPARRP